MYPIIDTVVALCLHRGHKMMLQSICLSRFLIVSFATWQYACIAISNVFDRGQQVAMPAFKCYLWGHIALSRNIVSAFSYVLRLSYLYMHYY